MDTLIEQPKRDHLSLYLNGVCVALVVVVLSAMAVDRWRRAREESLAEQQQQEIFVARMRAVESLKNVKDAQELAAAFRRLDPEMANYVSYSNGLREAVSRWYARDYRTALGMVEELPEFSRRQTLRRQVLEWGEKYYQKDPELFLSVTRKHLEGGSQLGVTLMIFRELAKSDPAKGIELLATVETKPFRGSVIHSFFSTWARSNSRDAFYGVAALEDPHEQVTGYAAVARTP